jgi:hypothetical protein
MDDSRVKDAASLLSAFFDQEKLAQGGRYASFFASWKALVGERLAAHSWIADIDRGILIVEAEHPGWIQLLQLRQREILASIAHSYPDFGLKSIVFRLGKRGSLVSAETKGPSIPGPFGPCARPEEAGSCAEAGPAEALKPETTLDSIENPELRGLLSGLKKMVDEADKGSSGQR